MIRAFFLFFCFFCSCHFHKKNDPFWKSRRKQQKRVSSRCFLTGSLDKITTFADAGSFPRLIPGTSSVTTYHHSLPPGRRGPNDTKQCLCGLWCFSKPLEVASGNVGPGEVFFEMLQWSCFVLVVVFFSRCKIFFKVNSLLSNMVLG